MTRTITLCILILFTTAAPIFAYERTEDVRLRGRGIYGGSIAHFWNTTDDATRRFIIVGGSIAIIVGLGLGIRHFIRETKECMAPKIKKPWDV